ncbi:MAG: twin-arginine translocation signal domain-containing protein, partial [Thermomicrobiales bacterium]
MAFYSPRERHVADLHEAFRTESIDRRTFMKVAGAAALASGLGHNASIPALAAPRRGIRAQPEA